MALWIIGGISYAALLAFFVGSMMLSGRAEDKHQKLVERVEGGGDAH